MRLVFFVALSGTCLLLALAPPAGRADHPPPTWVYTGTVVTVNDPGGFLGVSAGDFASGRITWTTHMDEVFSGATVAFYQAQSGLVIGARLHVGGVEYGPVASANVTLQMHDDNATFADRFSLANAAVTNTAGLAYTASGLSVALRDDDQTVFSDTGIPAGLPTLAALESATASLTLTNIDGTSDSANVLVDLKTLEPDPSPPDSSAPAASGPALGVLGALLLLIARSSLRARRRER
jgi:hypothetical protein